MQRNDSKRERFRDGVRDGSESHDVSSAEPGRALAVSGQPVQTAAVLRRDQSHCATALQLAGPVIRQMLSGIKESQASRSRRTGSTVHPPAPQQPRRAWYGVGLFISVRLLRHPPCVYALTLEGGSLVASAAVKCASQVAALLARLIGGATECEWLQQCTGCPQAGFLWRVAAMGQTQIASPLLSPSTRWREP